MISHFPDFSRKDRSDSASIATAEHINKTLEMSCVRLTRYFLSGMLHLAALETFG